MESDVVADLGLQAHRAVLIGGAPAIVEVQYPEVAKLYEADFDNMEICVNYLMPENAKLVEGLRRTVARAWFAGRGGPAYRSAL